MDNLNELKEIWLSAKTDGLPGSNEMLKLVKKFRNQRVLKKLIIIFIALILGAMMVYVVIDYKSTMVTTRLGEFLLIGTCLVLVTTNVKSIKRFYELNDCSNKRFIEFLEQTRRNQVFFYQKTQVAAMSLSSAGLLLYLYEGVHKNIVTCIVVYSLTLVYLLVLWLVVRPRVFKKGQRKLNETMEKLNKISNQIK